MRILLAESNDGERQRLLSVLLAAGHQVEHASDASALIARALECAPDVVVLNWALRGGTGAQNVSQLRAIGTERHLYIVVMSSSSDASVVAQAFKAGADDFLRKPVCHEELRARVDGPNRIAAWAHLVRVVKADEASGASKLSHIRAWRDTGLICSEIAELVGTSLSMAESEPPDPVMFAAEIPLTLPSEGLEIRIGVGIDAQAYRALSELLLGGDDSAEAMRDVLREMANTAGGTFKRAATVEGIHLTMGLPSDQDPFDAPVDDTRARKWVATSDRGFSVRFLATIHCAVPRKITSGELVEGMVVARDIKNATGVLLVAAGTRLSSRIAARTVELLGPSWPVEVVIPSTLAAEAPADAA